jgi:hypothetical protein
VGKDGREVSAAGPKDVEAESGVTRGVVGVGVGVGDGGDRRDRGPPGRETVFHEAVQPHAPDVKDPRSGAEPILEDPQRDGVHVGGGDGGAVGDGLRGVLIRVGPRGDEESTVYGAEGGLEGGQAVVWESGCGKEG